MEQKKRKRVKKLDFLPNRLNHYSIRKFTIGTASILVGSALLFGIGSEAKADEQSSHSTVQDEGVNKDKANIDDSVQESASTEEVSTEEKASETESTEEVSTEEKASETESTEEVSTEEKAPEAESTEEASTEEKAPETESTEEASTEEKAPEAESTEEASTEEKAPEAESTEEASTEEKAPEAESTEEASTEEKAPETESTEEAGTEEKASEAEKTEEVSTEEKAPEAEKTEEASTEEKAPETEATSKTTNKVAPEKAQSAKSTLESNTANKNDDYSISQVRDEETAATYYKKAANVSDKQAREVISNLNLDTKNLSEQELQYELIKALANKQKNNKPLATALRAASPKDEESLNIASNELINTLAVTDKSKVIEADAIKNGYIKSQTDATNAVNTLSGRAWIVDKGTPATMSNGLTAVPEGTKVYLQWIDKDGAVSPTYMATTSNKLSSSDGSQVGPGAYAFDLRDAWTDANGKEHKYNSSGGQLYRLWIEDFETENGNTATMIRQAGGFYPGRYTNSVSNSNLGQFPLIGTNMQRTGIYMGVKPTNDYMTTDKSNWIHDEEGPISSPAVDTKAKNSVSGQVWFETGAGDYANSATGPNNNSKDPEAAGYTVVMSSLTEEGAKQYKAQVNSLPEKERAAAAKALLEANPDYISATVYGETDDTGRYTLRFPDGTLNTSYMYGYVMDPDGNVVNAYSSYTSPQFRAPNSNLSWAPQTAPAQNLVANPMWYNVNFALVPSNDINLDVLEYNNTDKPAVPGDEVHIDLTGSNISPLPTRVEWRDKNGNVVQKTGDINTLEDGEQQGTFIVPDSAVDGDIYTAYLVVGDNDVAADSFIVKVMDNRQYEPTTDGVTKDHGTPTTTDDVTGSVTIPDYPTDKDQPTITVDDETQLPDGNTPGTTDVDVTVTYPDGSTDHIKVPVTVGEQADNDAYEPTTDGVTKDNGTPTTTDDVTGSVT
ncbi:YSIRK-type signal peptide-containing protein, partial [Mammaliicoccus sciuri]|uniref:YSIRK-type signal peptide-containing protein n=1 Tax=Mammaliicoccus sciuri TaxID=1296 RepID=UPI0039E0C140